MAVLRVASNSKANISRNILIWRDLQCSISVPDYNVYDNYSRLLKTSSGPIATVFVDDRYRTARCWLALVVDSPNMHWLQHNGSLDDGWWKHLQRCLHLLSFIHQFGAGFLSISDSLTLIGFNLSKKLLANVPPIIPGIEIKHKSETTNHTRSLGFCPSPIGYCKSPCQSTCSLRYPHEHVFPHLWQRTFLWKILSVPDMSCSGWGLNWTSIPTVVTTATSSISRARNTMIWQQSLGYKQALDTNQLHSTDSHEDSPVV